MCGIAGIKLFNSRPTISHETNLRDAIGLQAHRGPDSTNVVTRGSCVFGHNRLAVIDTNSRSDQPFVSNDGNFALVFNGEIYNYRQLRSQLEAKGYVFDTRSDTEVLLNLLIDEGKNALKKLTGCFAFCFYDIRENKLLLARDTMGIKPLLYWLADDRLCFASELSVLRKLGAPMEIDRTSLSACFQYSYIPGERTILKSVKRLLPGHYLELGQTAETGEYRMLIDPDVQVSTFEQSVDRTRRLVENAVVSQLAADVPLGTFLSGGIDSSIVTLIASRHVGNLDTFSISFSENTLLDEGKQAAKTAKALGTNHHEITLDRKAVIADLDTILDSFDEPFADSSAIAMYFLSRETRKGLTVALSGDGADELFGGYSKYAAFIRAQHISFLQKTVVAALSNFGKGDREGKLSNLLRKANKLNDFLRLDAPENLNLLASMIDYRFPEELLQDFERYSLYSKADASGLNQFLLADQRTVLPGDMLRKTDSMSMRHSLEVRTPFLDEHLIASVNALPAEWKNDGKRNKILLREAFGNELPAEIFQRPKHGFEVPLTDWLKELDPLNTYPHFFTADFVSGQQLFNFTAVKKMISDFNAGDKSFAQSLWAYLCFQKWYQRHQTL